MDINMSQSSLLTIQGNQPEAFSYPLTSYFLGVKTAGFALHPGYCLLDKAGFTCPGSAREQIDSLHQLAPLRILPSRSSLSLSLFLQLFSSAPMLEQSYSSTFIHR